MLYDGIGMVAKAIGAYTINVRGRGVQPRRGKLLAETLSTRVEDAQALILNRTTSTLRVPSSAVRCSTHSCSAAPFENGTMGRSGKMGRCSVRPRNGTAVFGGSPRDDERSDEVGRHCVG